MDFLTKKLIKRINNKGVFLSKKINQPYSHFYIDLFVKNYTTYQKKKKNLHTRKNIKPPTHPATLVKRNLSLRPRTFSSAFSHNLINAEYYSVSLLSLVFS